MGDTLLAREDRQQESLAAVEADGVEDLVGTGAVEPGDGDEELAQLLAGVIDIFLTWTNLTI